MDIKLSKEIEELGIEVSDVNHMLKASGEDKVHVYKEYYEPTLEELRTVLVMAYNAEMKRSRPVTKWIELISKLNK